MRVLLYGGSFDPVHAGHLHVAATAVRALGADRVLLVPAAVSPLKGRPGASPAERLEMCRLAVGDDPRLGVLDVEVVRGGRSYTIDTVQTLLDGPLRGDRAMLLVGQDALADLPRWVRARELAALVPIAVFPRPGAPDPDWDALAAGLGAEAAAGIRSRFLRVPTSPVSSTAVRERLAEGRSIRCWVPDAVADYIEARGLYRAA